MSLYKVRLFRLMEENKEDSIYEVYPVGTIIASKGINCCKEYLYGNVIPIIDRKDSETGEHIDSYNMNLTSKVAETGYIVFKEDFNLRRKLTKEDLIDFQPDAYAKTLMEQLKKEKTSLKKLLKTKNGVVYGRDIKRS